MKLLQTNLLCCRVISNNKTVQNHPLDHFYLLTEHMNNSSFKGAYMVSSLDFADTVKRHEEVNFNLTNDWYFLEERIYSSFMGMVFRKNSFLFEMFDEAIKQLTDTGIIDHIAKEFYEADPEKLRGKTDPKVILTTEHVGVIFLIWLACLALSVAAFIAELLKIDLQNLFRRKFSRHIRKIVQFISTKLTVLSNKNARKKRFNPKNLLLALIYDKIIDDFSILFGSANFIQMLKRLV